MDPRFTNNFGIGGQNALAGTINGNITVLAGNNINITPTTAQGISTLTTYIGYSPTGGVVNTTTNVTAGNNITLTRGAVAGTRSAGIGGRGDVFVSAGGNIALTALGSANYYIGTDDLTNIHGTIIRSAGNIVGTNPAAAVGLAVFGRNPGLAFGAYPLDIRAAGNIQFSTGYTVTGAATIFIEADTPVLAGQFGAICGTIVPTVSLIPPDNLGSVSVNKANPGVTPALLFQTAAGALTINSGANNATGTLQTLLIGTGAANDLRLATTNGALSIGGSVAADAFTDITITNTATMSTTGSIYVRANRNLTVNSAVTSTGAATPITLISDNDLDGIGNINLASNVTASGGTVSINAGVVLDGNSLPVFNPNIPASASTANVNQNNVTVSTAGAGQILGQAAHDYLLTGAAGAITAQTGTIQISVGNDIAVNGAATSISTTSGSINLDAGHDIDIDKIVQSTLGGAIAMNARNDINTAALISTTTGAITLIADTDNTGFGDLTINANITSSAGGNICLAAGPGTFGCDQNNCHSGLISGFPVGNCTVNIAAGTVSSTTGAITVTSAQDIIVNGASPSISTAGPIALTAGLGNLTINQQILSTGSSVTTFAGNNTILTQGGGPTLISSVGEIRLITGLDMTLNAGTAVASTGAQVTIVVDNIHPFQPVFPAAQSGSLTMAAASSLDSGSPLRIFTAYSQAFLAGIGVNSIHPTALFNGVTAAAFGYPGTIGVNTAIEQWCTFFGCPSNYPFPNLGVPFTFFYKVCVPVLAQQAQIIVTEFLLDLHPSNEFPGWMEEFWVEYSKTPSRKDPTRVNSLTVLDNEPFYSRRRHLNVINHPKTWTSWFE